MSGRLRKEFFTFVLALQFLTRLPLPTISAYSRERFAASVRHYPLAGMLIGAFAAAVYAACATVFPSSVAVLLSTVLTILTTGAFHEDGLADTFDGIGGGPTRERSLEIMKDSRVGAFGATALFMILVIKVTTLSTLSPLAVIVGLIAAHGLSRWSSVVVIATSQYVRDEVAGKPTAGGISKPGLIYATSIGLICLALPYFLLSPSAAVCSVVGLAAGHAMIRLFYERKIGGYTGDCLGATQQVSEVGVYLGLLACQ